MVSHKVRIDFGNGNVSVFTSKGKKRFPLSEDTVAVNCDVILADGSKWDGICLFDESSSGEHWGTLLFTADGNIADDGDIDEFLKTLGKTREEVFPYKYKYRVPLHCEDHHVGEDGWSS